jgi:hypothetical protein
MKDHNTFVFGVEQSRVKAFLNYFTPKVKALWFFKTSDSVIYQLKQRNTFIFINTTQRASSRANINTYQEKKFLLNSQKWVRRMPSKTGSEKFMMCRMGKDLSYLWMVIGFFESVRMRMLNTWERRVGGKITRRNTWKNEEGVDTCTSGSVMLGKKRFVVDSY